jgi:hypothetical protein
MLGISSFRPPSSSTPFNLTKGPHADEEDEEYDEGPIVARKQPSSVAIVAIVVIHDFVPVAHLTIDLYIT